jgi:hypothetical protein
MAARLVRRDPDYRWYLVRQRSEPSSTDAYFLFFADDSDISDLSTSLAMTLPVPPADAPRGVAFLVLPGRRAEARAITDVYPDAREQETLLVDGKLVVYFVDRAGVERAYRSREPGATTGED